ncbi:MAG TPA: LCP family protein [Clostridiales bacterium]|nr:LCP family protein [Clostridiales bacterium]
MKDRRQRSISPALKNLLIFLSTIFICAIVFTIVTIIIFKNEFFDRSQTSSVVFVDKRPPENENILLVQKRNGSDTDAERFWLIGLDFSKKNITVSALFPETLTFSGGRSDTLKGQFAYAGINHAVAAVEGLFDIKIARYAVLSKSDLVSIIDWHGGIVFTPDKRVSYTDPDTGVTVTLEPERQNLKGGQVLALLDYENNDAVERISIEQNLLEAFFNQYVNETYLNYAEKNYLFMIELMDTNLSYANIRDWLPHLYEIAKADKPCTALSVAGEYKYIDLRNVFIVSDECIERFGKEYD